MVIVDTNILIDHLRKSDSNFYNNKNSILQNIFKFYLQKNKKIAISQVTIQELYAGKSMQDKQVELKVLDLLQSFTILPYKYHISVLAGKLMQSNTITFADSVIASTSIYYDCGLITFNNKHFKDINELNLIDYKSFK